MRVGAFILTLVAALSVTAPAFAQTTGSIAGCLSNVADEGLARATVNVTTEADKRTTLADERGCFEFRDLPAGLYRVTARLQGYDNVTRDQVKVSPGQVQRIDLTMPISTICDCLARPTTLAGLYNGAAAVVYARILPPSQRPSRRGYFAHTAEVVEAFKRDPDGGPADKALRFLQSQANGAPDPYQVGQELVLFLFWWPAENAFSDGLFPYSVSVVSVEAGTITDAPAELKSYIGQPIGGFLADLRTLTPR